MLILDYYNKIRAVKVKARTHRPILRGLAAESAVESADSSSKSGNINTDTPVGMLYSAGSS